MLPLCDVSSSDSAVTLPATIDTTPGAPNSLCTTYSQDELSADEVCLVVGSTIDGPESVRAIGTRPLVLVAFGDLTLNEVDAASHRGEPVPVLSTASPTVVRARVDRSRPRAVTAVW